jgi:mycothiol synthase
MTHETDASGVAPGRDLADLTNERLESMTDTTLAVLPGLRLVSPDTDLAGLASRMAPIPNACNVQDGMDELVTPEELLNWLNASGEHFDPAKDLRLAVVDDQLVGYTWVDWVDTTDGLREYRLGGYVQPDWQRRGIGTALLAWGEQHSREHAGAHPSERPSGFGSWASEKRVAKAALLTKHGYTQVRWFFDMLRPDLEGIDIPPLPEGLEIRPVGGDEAAWRELFAADVEAFLDHWGGFAADEAHFQEWIRDSSFDPSLYVVAWDGEQIAGGVENAIYAKDNEAFNRRRGWLDSVFVRRPWRRRGLGAALVARSLVRLREAGMSEAMLGVDSANPTGALGLYERAGFKVHTRSQAFRKPM